MAKFNIVNESDLLDSKQPTSEVLESCQCGTSEWYSVQVNKARPFFQYLGAYNACRYCHLPINQDEANKKHNLLSKID